MHNAAFQEYGIDAEYELREIEPDEISGFVSEARGANWLGFQVTAPYKLAVMDHLDEIEAAAARVGAVNSVARRDDGRLVGFNTDAPGFRRAAEAELEIGFRDLRVAVAGAGGAARAVVESLVSAKAASIVVGNRTVSKAVAVAGDFGETVRATDLGEAFDGALRDADLAVNATTLGMVEAGAAFDVEKLPASASVFDLVYTPPESTLLERARKRGLRTCNGLGMLVAQAEIAFARWTGVPDAGAVMRAALELHIGEMGAAE
jgi:shikimate dehydrogenase